MKKIILSLTLIGTTQSLIAQMPNHHWTRSADGGASAIGKCMTVDAEGNVYTAGVFGSTSDFDNSLAVNNLTSNGATDIFLVKTNPQGNFLWAKNFGGLGDDIPSEIVLDETGNIYITGTFTGTADFDPDAGVTNLVSAGMEDVFVVKVNPSGQLDWAKSIGGTDIDEGNSIDIDDFDGAVFVFGSFRSTVDFDPGAGVQNATSNGSSDIFMLKLSAAGNYVTSKTIGSSSADRGRAIVVNSETGDQFMTGMFGGDTDFDPGIPDVTLTGANDIFVLKLDEFNNFIFAKKMGGVALDEGRSIDIDDNGFIYVHGSFISTCNFDPNGGTTAVTSNGSDDVFVVQLTPDGSLNWVSTFGSTGTEDFMDMDVTNSGAVYITGEMANNMDANPDVVLVNMLTKLGAEDAYIIALNSNGTFNWATNYGTADIGAYTRGYGIYVDESSNVYTTGSFTGTVDFDASPSVENMIAGAGSDVWYQKMGLGTNSLSNHPSISHLSVSPNPSAGIFNLNSDIQMENAQMVITNLRGEVIQTTTNFDGNNFKIDMENTASGVYLITIVSNKFQEVIKVVKE